jgi:hypothetical protein
MAKGEDADIGLDDPEHSADTFIMAKIFADEATGALSARAEFLTKIYDESGKKIYTFHGKLKDAALIMPGFSFLCSVRGVTWINLWFIMGVGEIKTSDSVITDFPYRGQIITLPNTDGEYVPANIMIFLSQEGEHTTGFWPQGGWAYGGIMQPTGNFGGITYLTKYVEN